MLGNVKTALARKYSSFNHAKYGARYAWLNLIFADGFKQAPIFEETPPDYVIKNFARMGMHARMVGQAS